MLRELKRITDKPVRTVINTHFHFDHANGNQIFQPPTEIIGHVYTRNKLMSPDIMRVGTFADSLAALPNNIQNLKNQVAAERDPSAKAGLEQQLRVQEAYAEQVKETRPTPPNVTLQDRMTLTRGDREIRLLFVGRGHTGGDVVVYLPKERLLCTGDLLLTTNTPFAGDGYVNEWPDTLEKLRAIDFEDVIPGHGEPFKGKEKISYWQVYLRDLWQQTSKLHDRQVPPADAVKQIDLTAHKAHFPTITGVGVGVNAAAVARMYAVMERRAD
jgi:glyoxylase-like metal-dependent hydrolase (beta-lactamase superfamily II)